VIGAGLVQVDHNLQWEDQVAVKVAVQRIPVPCLVAKQNRGRLALSGVVAHPQPLVERVRPPGGPAELGRPVTGDRQQLRVQRLLQVLDGLGVGGLEITVLTFAETVPTHVDCAAKVPGLPVELADSLCLIWGEQRRQEGTAEGVNLRGDRFPFGRIDPLPPGVRANGAAAHADASRLRSAIFAAGPPT
jgi:hypothetical protein